MNKQYLQRFKDLAYIINAKIRAYFSIGLGDFVCFKFLQDEEDIDGYLIAMQIMSVQTDGKYTTLRGRQVTPIIEPIAEPDIVNERVTDGAGSTFFADGAGNILGWYGDQEYINISPSFDVDSLDKLNLIQYQEMLPVILPEAKSPIGNPIDYLFSPILKDGLQFDSQTRILKGTANLAQGETDYTYTAKDLVTGQTTTLTQPIEVFKGIRNERPVFDGDNAIFFADGAGNISGWYGY